VVCLVLYWVGPALADPPPPARATASLTAHVTGEPVVDLLPELARQVKGRWSADEPIGERRVHVLVDGVPAVRLRAALAAVVDGRWTRRRDDSLRLEADPAAARAAERELARRKQRFFDGLHQLVRNLALDAAGLERLQKTDPSSAAALTMPTHRSAVQLAGLLQDSQWQQLAAGGRLAFSTEQLGPQGPALMRAYVEQMNQGNQAVGQPPLDVEKFSRGTLLFEVNPDSNGDPYGYLGVGLRIERPDAGGNMSQSAMITGSRPTEGPAPRWRDYRGSSGDPVPPGPAVTLNFDPPPADWGAALKRAAEQLKIPVVSEDLTASISLAALSLFSPEYSGKVPEILDQICQQYGYEWRLEDGIYRFRSVAWFALREAEPPGTLVKALAQARAAKQLVGLDWLARAAALPPTQQRTLCGHLYRLRGILFRAGPVLRFYGALTPEQRVGLATPAGIQFGDLPAAPRSLLLAAVQAQARDWPPEAAAQARVTLAQEKGTARFTFTSGERTAATTIALPAAAARVPGPTGACSGSSWRRSGVSGRRCPVRMAAGSTSTRPRKGGRRAGGWEPGCRRREQRGITVSDDGNREGG
jgi:hypothetical protein